MATRSGAFAATTTATGGINSLATSSTWVAGYEWFYIDLSSAAIDCLVELAPMVGTTPTINTEIRIYAFPVGDGGTVYPDVMDGTPSAETWTSAGVRDSCAKLVAVGIVDATTSNITYPCSFNVLSFWPTIPKKIGIFVTHNTGTNLNSTAGNQKYQYTIYTETIA